MEDTGKLVRDRIAELIEAAGGAPTTRRLEASERLPALLAKLQEESDELREASTAAHRAEELADVFEVLLGIAQELELPWAEVEVLAADKRAARGGFTDGLWMTIEDRDVVITDPPVQLVAGRAPSSW
jgi:predicted house-cleaning noncanonical NTP pyrophosphatase (MazG superfamily)